MALGPFGFGVIDAGNDTTVFAVLAQLALTVILFNQAAMLDLPSVVRRGRLTFRLLLIGIPLSIALGTGLALLVMPVLSLWEAVCLAAIVAPTEVALIDALLEDKRIPERVRHALLPARSRLFIGWFGPRGIGTLVLVLLMIERGEIHQSAMITQAVVVTVTISLVVHSLTKPLGIRLWPAPAQEETT